MAGPLCVCACVDLGFKPWRSLYSFSNLGLFYISLCLWCVKGYASIIVPSNAFVPWCQMTYIVYQSVLVSNALYWLTLLSFWYLPYQKIDTAVIYWPKSCIITPCLIINTLFNCSPLWFMPWSHDMRTFGKLFAETLLQVKFLVSYSYGWTDWRMD